MNLLVWCFFLLVGLETLASHRLRAHSPPPPSPHSNSLEVKRALFEAPPSPSKGCQAKMPSWVTPSKTTTSSVAFAGVTRTFRIHVPKSYDIDKPVPLLLSIHGWGGTGAQDERDTGLSPLSEKHGFIVVYPDGFSDNPNDGDWGSWNGGGTTDSPGPAGKTCIDWASTQEYCYDSCKARPQGCADGCDWTTCQPDIKYIEYLYQHLEESFCVDTTREYATGMSNGGIFVYQMGVSLAHRLAAIVPMCGAFMRGFETAPPVPMPVMDIHGTADRVVPANSSLSYDGWYYATTAETFSLWKVANQCKGANTHYKTSVDGVKDLYCVAEGECQASVVRCAFTGAHTYFANIAVRHGTLVWEFLSKHRKLPGSGAALNLPDVATPPDM